jgi:hypothetical protein
VWVAETLMTSRERSIALARDVLGLVDSLATGQPR